MRIMILSLFFILFSQFIGERILHYQSRKLTSSSSNPMCFMDEETGAPGRDRTCLRTWGWTEPELVLDTG